MDAMRMDERQRWNWLLANRATLFIVGFCWLGLIAWEASHGRTPYFLIVMVPVFALIRLGFYQAYSRKNVRV
jgi:hypothetical protein